MWRCYLLGYRGNIPIDYPAQGNPYNREEWPRVGCLLVPLCHNLYTYWSVVLCGVSGLSTYHASDLLYDVEWSRKKGDKVIKPIYSISSVSSQTVKPKYLIPPHNTLLVYTQKLSWTPHVCCPPSLLVLAATSCAALDIAIIFSGKRNEALKGFINYNYELFVIQQRNV